MRKVNRAGSTTKDYIKWVDFTVSKFALSESYEYDQGYVRDGPAYQLDRSVGLDSGTHRRKALQMTGRSAACMARTGDGSGSREDSWNS